MGRTTELVEVATSSLVPYSKNAKLHGKEQVEKIKASIEEFGFVSPCLIDRQNNIIAGHGRVLAAKELGMQTVPCVYVEGLTETQRRAYILADNKLTELGEWDMDIVNTELLRLDDEDFVVELTGFEMPENTEQWFSDRERWDNSREKNNDEYNEFLDKFEQPKTTDDCYTPDNIYDVIAEYVATKYKRNRADFVRPFYPGGNYQSFNYSAASVVVDNPPFSILAEIVDFYVENKQAFFLFAPGLSCLGYTNREGVTAICTYAPITYENGATVTTSFVTNLEPDDVAAKTDPELYKAVEDKNEENEERLHRHFPKYEYPVHVATAAKLGYLSKYGQTFIIKRKDGAFIRALDAQRDADKGIYGSAFLLSEKAAAEKAAAEKAAAEKAAATVWALSEREREIIKNLGE